MRDDGDCLTRFWLNMPGSSSRHLLTLNLWNLCSVLQLKDRLAEEGYFLRWHDEITDTGVKNGLRDVYIRSTILEKLCV